ncbi:MAG: ATP-binding protein [Acidaminococcales bacterium]|jgi:anti-sigma regulatory factor (Ser/Thr protein kinase)|nr:ATP-binding protein [Acidaminococcales bacterium]
MRDLSLHVLDLVQNAVAAGAKNISLLIGEDGEKDLLSIEVSDDGKGMAPDFAACAKDPFATTRTSRKVGLGLPLMDMTAKRAGGRLDIDSRPGEGTKITAVYRLSHIDRPPLGDIAATVKIIAAGCQGIFFRYEHRKGHNAFVLDTKAMREILGGEVDFGESAVMEWLDGFLREGLLALDKTEG